MSTVPDSVLDAELASALRARGHRVTAPRLLVHRHVRRSRGHLTPEQLHGELAPGLPSLSPATIYATLELLDELGFVRRVSTPRGTTVYDPRTDPHHHVICRRCGRMEDIEAAVDAGAAQAAAAAAGFTVDHGELQLSGLCRACVDGAG
ncbi:MAG TPA: transcriptional repressor [Solirubrobacteraceae bacterium]|nr:transcriptional repressor [Solirubrobacteraceae bacterium]